MKDFISFIICMLMVAGICVIPFSYSTGFLMLLADLFIGGIALMAGIHK